MKEQTKTAVSLNIITTKQVKYVYEAATSR